MTDKSTSEQKKAREQLAANKEKWKQKEKEKKEMVNRVIETGRTIEAALGIQLDTDARMKAFSDVLNMDYTGPDGKTSTMAASIMEAVNKVLAEK